MANRNFAPEKGSLRRGLVSLHGTIGIGATGAVGTLVGGVGKTGFTLARTGTGAYTITLVDGYSAILAPNIVIMSPSSAATDGMSAFVTAVNVAAKTITFLCKTNNGAYTTADPPSNATMLIELRVVDSSI